MSIVAPERTRICITASQHPASEAEEVFTVEMAPFFMREFWFDPPLTPEKLLGKRNIGPISLLWPALLVLFTPVINREKYLFPSTSALQNQKNDVSW